MRGWGEGFSLFVNKGGGNIFYLLKTEYETSEEALRQKGTYVRPPSERYYPTSTDG